MLRRSSLTVVVLLTIGGCSTAPAATTAPPLPTSTAVIVDSPSPAPAGPTPSPTSEPTPTLTPHPPPEDDTILTRIAFISCLRDPSNAPGLGDVVRLNPDLTVWLGDNIYGDTDNRAQMRTTYARLASNADFQRLRTIAAEMAVWDDHDYGVNNGDEGWHAKEMARQEFNNFWRVPSGDLRQNQPGVYSARRFGSGDRIVQVILLDNRYNRSAWGSGPGHTMLGEEQWAWLKERLAEPATIRIIGAGMQIVSDNEMEGPFAAEWESWGDMPDERQRLFDLIRTKGIPGVILASGDMHWAELSRLGNDAAGFGYPTYDLTGSGLDQQETLALTLPNPLRIGEVLNNDRKFGFITIDWSQVDPVIHLQIRNGANENSIHVEQVVRLSELRPPE